MVHQVVENDLCNGCGLCASLFYAKVSMCINPEGFLRPIQHEELESKEETLFAKSCPGINVEQKRLQNHNYNTIWGPIKNLLVGHATDEEVRFRGSSGGGISGFAQYLLSEKIVDFVLHTGASQYSPLHNDTTRSLNRSDIIHKAGSRYSPSSPLIEIKKYLAEDRKFAFVGKPCDIVGLKNYLHECPQHKDKVVVFISFMCAGIPSINGTKEILNRFNVNINDVKSIQYRGEGWPGKFKVVDRKNNEHKISYNESWGTVLNRHLQFRCKICPDGTGEFADVTFADAWEESENGYPSFEEKAGESLIITRTTVGQRLIKEAIGKNFLVIQERRIDPNVLEKIQPYQAERKKAIIPRLIAMRLMQRQIPIYNWQVLFQSTKKLSLLKISKNFAGMVKRLIK